MAKGRMAEKLTPDEAREFVTLSEQVLTSNGSINRHAGQHLIQRYKQLFSRSTLFTERELEAKIRELKKMGYEYLGFCYCLPDGTYADDPSLEIREKDADVRVRLTGLGTGPETRKFHFFQRHWAQHVLVHPAYEERRRKEFFSLYRLWPTGKLDELARVTVDPMLAHKPWSKDLYEHLQKPDGNGEKRSKGAKEK